MSVKELVRIIFHEHLVIKDTGSWLRHVPTDHCNQHLKAGKLEYKLGLEIFVKWVAIRASQAPTIPAFRIPT